MGEVLLQLDREHSLIAIGAFFRSRYVWMRKPFSAFDADDCAISGECSHIHGNNEKIGKPIRPSDMKLLRNQPIHPPATLRLRQHLAQPRQ